MIAGRSFKRVIICSRQRLRIAFKRFSTTVSAQQQVVPEKLSMPKSAWLFGLGGLAPFGAAWYSTLKDEDDSPQQDRTHTAHLVYGASISSFLGAVHWGMEMGARGTGMLLTGSPTVRLAYSVTPSIISWMGVCVYTGSLKEAFAIPQILNRNLTDDQRESAERNPTNVSKEQKRSGAGMVTGALVLAWAYDMFKRKQFPRGYMVLRTLLTTGAVFSLTPQLDSTSRAHARILLDRVESRLEERISGFGALESSQATSNNFPEMQEDKNLKTATAKEPDSSDR